MSYDNRCEFSALLGCTLARIECAAKYSDRITFTLDDGRTFIMRHYQDCCESVSVADVVGDVADLIGSPIVLAEESSNQAEAADFATEHYFESGTWTFYRIATAKGHVDIRWLGESNGYYSEGVDFECVQ